MITKFLDTETTSDHDQFQAWRTKHQDDAVLTLEAKSNARLHGVRCPHFGSGPPYFSYTDGFGSLTSRPKVCGSESELIQWADQNGVVLKGCKHCFRDGLIRLLNFEPSLKQQAAETEAMNDYVAYHSESVMGYPYVADANSRVTFLTTKSEGMVRRILGNTVWIFSGAKINGRTRYLLHGKFRPDGLLRGDNSWEISGPGMFLTNPINVSDEPWFRELLGEQANFSLGLNRTHSASALSVLYSMSLKTKQQPSRDRRPEEVTEGNYREGQGIQISVNRYERDPSARSACLKHFGLQCQICRQDLSSFYGPIAAGLVHVHHLRPLSLVEGEYEVLPEHDLIPVCPNCHAVVHRHDPPLTPEEVCEMIAQAGAKKT